MAFCLITGGCGFIGRNVVRRLVSKAGPSIRILDNLTVGKREDLAAIHPFEERPLAALRDEPSARVELAVGDIRDEDAVRQAVKGAAAVVHLAANTGVGPSVADPRSDCITNVVGTLNCLEGCRAGGVRRFVFASSGAPIGECEPPLHEELPAHPVSPYGASKLAGEAYCSAYSRSFGIDAVALRFGNCYGPFSSHKSSIVAKFIREALAGQPWEIYGDGTQTRDFIYVDDIVDAIVRAITAEGIGGEVFQIATNEETSVGALAEKLSAVLGRHQIRLPGRHNMPPRTGDVRRNFSDTRKAKSRLAWSAQVGLDEGLTRTVRWFLERAP